MLDTMYDVPSVDEVKEVIVNENVILNGESPMLVYENGSAAKAG